MTNKMDGNVSNKREGGNENINMIGGCYMEFQKQLNILLTNPNSDLKNAANEWLLSFQKSSLAWEVARLLVESGNPEQQLAGAHTMSWKMKYEGRDLKKNERELLIQFIINLIEQKQAQCKIFDEASAAATDALQKQSGDGDCAFNFAATERLAECVAFGIVRCGNLSETWLDLLRKMIEIDKFSKPQQELPANFVANCFRKLSLRRVFILMVFNNIPQALDALNFPGCATANLAKDQLMGNEEFVKAILDYLAETLHLCSAVFFFMPNIMRSSPSLPHSSINSKDFFDCSSLENSSLSIGATERARRYFNQCIEASLSMLSVWTKHFDFKYVQNESLSVALSETIIWLSDNTCLSDCISALLASTSQYGKLWLKEENNSKAVTHQPPQHSSISSSNSSFAFPNNKGEHVFLQTILFFLHKLSSNAFVANVQSNEKIIREEVTNLFRFSSSNGAEALCDVWWLNPNDCSSFLSDSNSGNKLKFVIFNDANSIYEVLESWHDVIEVLIDGYPQILFDEAFGYIRQILKMLWTNHPKYMQCAYRFWVIIKELSRERNLQTHLLQNILSDLGTVCFSFILSKCKSSALLYSNDSCCLMNESSSHGNAQDLAFGSEKERVSGNATEEEDNEWSMHTEMISEIICDLYFLYESVNQRKEFLSSFTQEFLAAMRYRNKEKIELMLILCDSLTEAINGIPAEFYDILIFLTDLPPDDKKCVNACGTLLRKISLYFAPDHDLLKHSFSADTAAAFSLGSNRNQLFLVESAYQLEQVWCACLKTSLRLFSQSPALISECIYDLCCWGGYFLNYSNSTNQLPKNDFFLNKFDEFVRFAQEVSASQNCGFSVDSSLHAASVHLLCHCFSYKKIPLLFKVLLHQTTATLETLSSSFVSLPLVIRKKNAFRLMHRLYRCMKSLQNCIEQHKQIYSSSNIPTNLFVSTVPFSAQIANSISLLASPNALTFNNKTLNSSYYNETPSYREDIVAIAFAYFILAPASSIHFSSSFLDTLNYYSNIDATFDILSLLTNLREESHDAPYIHLLKLASFIFLNLFTNCDFSDISSNTSSFSSSSSSSFFSSSSSCLPSSFFKKTSNITKTINLKSKWLMESHLTEYNDYSLLFITIATLRCFIATSLPVSSSPCAALSFSSSDRNRTFCFDPYTLSNFYLSMIEVACDIIKADASFFSSYSEGSAQEKQKIIARGSIVCILSDIVEGVSRLNSKYKNVEDENIIKNNVSKLARSIEEKVKESMDLLWKFFYKSACVLQHTSSLYGMLTPYFEFLKSVAMYNNTASLLNADANKNHNNDSNVSPNWSCSLLFSSASDQILTNTVRLAAEILLCDDKGLINMCLKYLLVVCAQKDQLIRAKIEKICPLIVFQVLKNMHKWDANVMTSLWRLMACIGETWNYKFSLTCKFLLFNLKIQDSQLLDIQESFSSFLLQHTESYFYNHHNLLKNHEAEMQKHRQNSELFANNFNPNQKALILQCFKEFKGARIRSLLTDLCNVANGIRKTDDVIVAYEMAIQQSFKQKHTQNSDYNNHEVIEL